MELPKALEERTLLAGCYGLRQFATSLRLLFPGQFAYHCTTEPLASSSASYPPLLNSLPKNKDRLKTGK